jgi:hypothetical protein
MMALYTADSIAESDSAFVDGRWVMARPINYKYESVLERIKQAYNVLIGKYDSIKWIGQ